MSKTVHLGYYFVAFIDILGQRDLLRGLASLPRSDSELQEAQGIIDATSEYVMLLRQEFDKFFEAVSNRTGLLDGLTPQQRAWAETRKQSPLWRRGFSDSYFMTVPCWYESSWGAHSLSIYAALMSISCLFIWALVKKRPFRGAVEVAVGTEIAEEEVYGPVNVHVIDLEKGAGYPRVVVGEGLLAHLGDLEGRCPDNLEGQHTKKVVHDCRGLITKDDSGTFMLDPMGEGVWSVQGAVDSRMIQWAYEFVVSQQEYFRDVSQKHFGYYGNLRTYCESRLALWGLSPF